MYSSLVFKFDDPPRFYSHHKLTQPILAQSRHSFSRVWALASYLERQFPHFPPPNRKTTEDIMVNCWCEILCQSITKEESYVQGNVLHFVLQLPLSYQQILKQQGFQLCQPESQKPKMKEKSILFINMSPTASMLNTHKFNLDAIYLGTLFDNEKWSMFHPITGDMPTEEQIRSVDIVIIPGSRLGVHSGNQTVNKLKKIMKEAILANPNLKVMGVCFGHQFLCDLMGGTVAKAHKMTKTVETLRISKEAMNHEFLREVHSVQNMLIAQLHQDQVKQLPQNFINVASSESCYNQIVVSHCGRYFGMQCHPDYTIQFLNQRSRHCGNSSLPEQQEDSQVLRSCMKQFIK